MQPLKVRVGVALRSPKLCLETPAPFETFGERALCLLDFRVGLRWRLQPRLPTSERSKGGGEALSRLCEHSRCDLLTTGHGRVSRA